jgi:gamma-glutamylcyclotransferase (GGCT)/AIG2-like uncharacterized protein YtfP
MKGEQHHEVLSSQRFVGPVRTRAEYDLVQIDYYPALLEGGSVAVQGELYEVDDATLAELDELEEVPIYYLRKGIELEDGTQAETYIMPRERVEGGSPIPTGYFRLRTAPPKRR